MALNINVLNSCKILDVSASRYDDTSTSADIKITDMVSGGSYTTVMDYDAAGKGRINIPAENLSASYSVF